MLIVLDPHSGVPVYRQLMDQIKFHIASGLLMPGDPLPSTRALSGELGLNPMTVSKAYSYLEMENVVERRPGLPLVVRSAEPAEAHARKLDQLRQSLAAPAPVARQLGVDPAEATRVFGDMLNGAGASPAGEGPDEPGGEQEP
jgi:GntR family transcriptional regulator